MSNTARRRHKLCKVQSKHDECPVVRILERSGLQLNIEVLV